MQVYGRFRWESARLRWFHSKGAFLVLLWTVLLSFVSFSVCLMVAEKISTNQSRLSHWLLVIPVLVILISASGWLANAKLGNYRVFSVGCVLLFVSTVFLCSFLVMKELYSDVLLCVHFTVVVIFWVLGCCMCLVTALQLGLDQMPDASSSNISSVCMCLIRWEFSWFFLIVNVQLFEM